MRFCNKKWLLMLCFTATVQAFDRTDELFDLSLTELMYLPVEGASVSVKSIPHTPSAVTVLNSRFIESTGVTYLYELLNFVLGFQSQRSGESAIAHGYSVRGRRNSNQSKETLLIMDGMILNDPRTDASNGSVKLFNVDQIERIEVIRGPGSVLYGSGAFSGVINIVTKQKQKSIKVASSAFQGRGITGHYDYHSTGWSSHFYVHGYSDTGDSYQLMDQSNRQVSTQDPYETAEVRVGVKNKYASITYMDYQSNTEDFTLLDSISNQFNKASYQHQQLHVSSDFPLSEDHDILFSVSGTQTHQDFDNQQVAAGGLALISSPSSNEPLILKSRLYSESIRLHLGDRYYWTSNLVTQVGFQWQKVNILESGAFANYDVAALITQQLPVEYYGDFSTYFASKGLFTKERAGVYVQSEWLREDDEFTFGLRLDQDSREQSQVTPRLGWVRSMSKGKAMKVLYGEAFRSSSLVEGLDPGSPILRGDPDLENETIKTWDLIFLSHAENFSYQLGVFHNQYVKPLLIEIASDGVRQYANGNEVTSTGIEAEWMGKLYKNYELRLTLSSAMSYPDEFFREAKDTASFSLNREYVGWHWNVSAFYHGEREQQVSATARTRIADYWVWNLSSSYEHNNRTRSKVAVENILNREFESVPQGSNFSEGLPNRGTAWRYTLSYSFN